MANQTAVDVRIASSGRLGGTYGSQKRFCNKSRPRVELVTLSVFFAHSNNDSIVKLKCVMRLTKSFISEISLSTSSMN